MLVQAFVAKSPVEALHEGVPGGFARRDEGQANLVVEGPLVERPTLRISGLLSRTIASGRPQLFLQAIEHADKLEAG